MPDLIRGSDSELSETLRSFFARNDKQAFGQVLSLLSQTTSGERVALGDQVVSMVCDTAVDEDVLLDINVAHDLMHDLLKLSGAHKLTMRQVVSLLQSLDDAQAQAFMEEVLPDFLVFCFGQFYDVLVSGQKHAAQKHVVRGLGAYISPNAKADIIMSSYDTSLIENALDLCTRKTSRKSSRSSRRR